MTTMHSPPTRTTATETLADLLERLGGISPARIRMAPAPGLATEADVIDIENRENRLFELIEGVLVEKAMSYRESALAIAIAAALRDFVKPKKLGIVTGADGMMRLFPGLVRIPDVAFASRERFSGGEVSSEAIAGFAPDLAVEVLSEGNTKAEMNLKRTHYFDSGVRLVWLIDLKTRTALVFTGVDRVTVLNLEQSLDGGDVLPGFKLPLRDVFGVLDL
jgi:Uma2 family endonuclease